MYLSVSPSLEFGIYCQLGRKMFCICKNKMKKIVIKIIEMEYFFLIIIIKYALNTFLFYFDIRCLPYLKNIAIVMVQDIGNHKTHKSDLRYDLSLLENCRQIAAIRTASVIGTPILWIIYSLKS